MRILALSLSALLGGCAIVSGLNDLQVCATACDGGLADGAGSDTSVPDGDAAGDDVVLGDAAAWSPASVVGLALWLNAAIGVTTMQGQVMAWADQSGNQNDATQLIPARQPILKPSSLNGLPVIHFTADVTSPNGTQLAVADSPTLQWGTGDYYIAVVASFDNSPTDGNVAGIGMLYAKVTTSAVPALSLTGNVSWGNNNVLPGFASTAGTVTAPWSGALNDGTPRLYACHRTGLTLTPRLGGVPGTPVSLSSATDVSAVGGSVFVGALGDATTDRLDGDIAEIIAVRAPAETDVVSIESYLATKHHL